MVLLRRDEGGDEVVVGRDPQGEVESFREVVRVVVAVEATILVVGAQLLAVASGEALP